jgi:hypothetical protein
VSGVWTVGALRPGPAAGAEDEGSLRERIARWRAYAEERVAYWTFSGQIAAETGLHEDVLHCGWKRAQFAELLECLTELEAACNSQKTGMTIHCERCKEGK